LASGRHNPTGLWRQIPTSLFPECWGRRMLSRCSAAGGRRPRGKNAGERSGWAWHRAGSSVPALSGPRPRVSRRPAWPEGILVLAHGHHGRTPRRKRDQHAPSGRARRWLWHHRRTPWSWHQRRSYELQRAPALPIRRIL
jgi:hypothetical protein